VDTEYQNWPSAILSRATIRAQRGSSATDGSLDFWGLASVEVMSVHLLLSVAWAMVPLLRALHIPVLAFSIYILRGVLKIADE
jgi:hypothetical protein